MGGTPCETQHVFPTYSGLRARSHACRPHGDTSNQATTERNFSGLVGHILPFLSKLLLSLPNKREISIFNSDFGGLTRSDTKFVNLSKFDIVRAKCFETRVFHLFSISLYFH